jgi:hypothetical protein
MWSIPYFVLRTSFYIMNNLEESHEGSIWTATESGIYI